MGVLFSWLVWAYMAIDLAAGIAAWDPLPRTSRLALVVQGVVLLFALLLLTRGLWG